MSNEDLSERSVDFRLFGEAVHHQYNLLSARGLFRVDVEPDELWEAYLASFPPGSNPQFRERTEHDCSTCRQFVKALGGVVALNGVQLDTVWDGVAVGYPYDYVALRMSEFVRSRPIDNVFFAGEASYGAATTKALENAETENGEVQVRRWHHFHGRVSNAAFGGAERDRMAGETRAAHQVVSRGLNELKTEVVEEVLALVAEGALYRGAEHRDALQAFAELKREFEAHDRDANFEWSVLHRRGARIRNSVIGSLLVELSEGKPMEKAVAAFESRVAPENYKRPTALITPRMVESAMAKVESLGLRSALDRRHARLEDVSVNDVLFVDSSVEPRMQDSVVSALMDVAQRNGGDRVINGENASELPVEEFLSSVLPGASSLELLPEARHFPLLMSMTAPVHAGAGALFPWGNNFAWSYDGDAADSIITQRVKRAGGRVKDAALRVSLIWFNRDDLDIRVQPPRGRPIYYGDKQNLLDVDMNVGGETREPVENVSWPAGRLLDGVYLVSVNNYRKRESVDVGFTLELAHADGITTYHHVEALPGNATVHCLEVLVRDGAVIRVVPNDLALSTEGAAQDRWGLTTGRLARVNALVRSPNHWNGAAHGNRHLFFLLSDCLNPEPVRGIYNEFLRPDLHQHRKVFEVLGAKTKAPFSEDQLSGLGFSSTRRESILARVTRPGSARIFNLQF